MLSLWGAPLAAAGTGAAAAAPSGDLPVTDYLGIPAAVGAVVTVVCFFASVWLVRRRERNRDNTGQVPRDWLERPILGSGAWTANDSWATNISTGFVVVGTILGATTAANSLFPGIALDRFAIANIAAGFFVAAAPVLFGIMYSWFTVGNPGLTADSTVMLAGLSAATIAVPSGATVTIAADTAVQDNTSRWVVLRAGGAYQIPQGARIHVVSGVRAAAQRCVDAAATGIADAAQGATQTAIQAAVTDVRLSMERALAKAVVEPPPAAAPAAPDAQDAPVAQVAGSPADAIAGQVAGAISWDDVTAATRQAVRCAHPRPDSIRPGAVDGIVGALRQAVAQSRIETSQTYGAMAYSGAADIGALPDSVLLLSDCNGMWTVSKDDVVGPNPPPRADTPLQHPVLIHSAGGAKVTVTGAADITVPEGAVVSSPSPRLSSYPLPRQRQLMAPQGTNLIVANLRIILAVNLLTMFGIGAQLGIAGVLTAYSDATGFGQIWALIALGAVAVFAIVYAATATRAVSDPQPGSSLSAQAGTSFTL
jgi:hypothetical protein